MDIETLRNFFLWCTIINGAMLIFSSIFCMLAKNWIYSIHSKLFSIPREAFNIIIYSFLGVYKIFVISLNLIPYLALVIIG